MIFVYIFIIGIPALLIFFIGKKMVRIRAVEKQGVQTNAVIKHIRLIKLGKALSDSVTIEYIDSAGTTHSGKITTERGKYKYSDIIPLRYLHNKPSHFAIKGMQQGQWAILVFCMVLLAFTIFASFKISELVEGTNFHFSP